MNLVNIDYINQKDKDLVELFISTKNIKKYILGINKLTKSVLKNIEVDGVIDDFTRVHKSRKKHILNINQIEKGSIILWVSTGSPLEVKNKLDLMGFENISYLSFCKYSNFNLIEHPFIHDFKDDYQNNYNRYNDIYNLLNDEISKTIFEKVINFKITFDYKFMNGFTNNHSEQYFDKDLIQNINNITFLDGGGYIGDSLPSIINKFPDFKKIYLIEPIKSNIEIAQKRFIDYKKIEFLNIGLSNKKERLTFNEEKSFSGIYNNGDDYIEVNTIDNLIGDKIDFIKLDIEGAEQDAIDGAKNTIKIYSPILAICIYHKAEDWYKIPEKILNINSNYKIYIRHYMEGIFETVMYFIPNK